MHQIESNNPTDKTIANTPNYQMTMNMNNIIDSAKEFTEIPEPNPTHKTTVMHIRPHKTKRFRYFPEQNSIGDFVQSIH
ncbi:unnamed protein product [Phytomonas sp. Hart1]|nr:unnamed protein product [Phytomonas sp. Hart1]|eukprot:CCW72209.1 unnamed protein product [Phytomonas sp. isolate Hart1]